MIDQLFKFFMITVVINIIMTIIKIVHTKYFNFLNDQNIEFFF